MSTTRTSTPDWVAHQSGPIAGVGYHDLEGRPAFKIALATAGDRYLLYLSHLWHSGWSIVDVTNPAEPQLVRFIPGPAHTWTLQVTTRGDLLATSMEPIPERWGGDPSLPFEEGIALWDIASPDEPKRLGSFSTGAGTHRNHFDEAGLLHLAARVPGYEGLIFMLVDVSDPWAPREISRFSMPGQEIATRESAPAEPHFGVHGPSLRVGDTAYLPYGDYGLVTLDLSDPARPSLLGHLGVHPPLGSNIAAHSAVPLPDRNLLILNSEAHAEDCQEPVGFAGMVDLAVPAAPRLMSLFPTPRPPRDASYRSFKEKRGRFGPHNQHIAASHPRLFNDDNLCFLTWFNAGLRVFDTSIPEHVEEIAYIIPKDPPRRIGVLPKTLVTQVEDVLVDDRGYAYFTEKNTGLYIAKWER